MSMIRKLMLILCPILILSCNKTKDMNLISSNQMQEAINDSSQVLDVRTPGEFSEGHIPGALNIDVNSPGFSQAVNVLDKEKPVYVYCRSGQRSSRAARELREIGFDTVYDLEGGIMAWEGQIEN